MVRSVFQITDETIRNPFVHALGPEVVRLVEEREEPVTVVIEALQVLELLLEMTPDAHSKSSQPRVPLSPSSPSPLPFSQSQICLVCCYLY